MNWFYDVSFLLEIIRHEPILLRIYFACASHFARWWGSAIVHTLNSIFGWRIKKAEPKILESRKLLSLKRPLLVHNVLWLFTETTGPRHRLWEGWVLENTSRDFLLSFGLSQHSEGCPTLGLIKFHFFH